MGQVRIIRLYIYKYTHVILFFLRPPFGRDCHRHRYRHHRRCVADATLFVCVSCGRSDEFRTFYYYYLFIYLDITCTICTLRLTHYSRPACIRKQNAQRYFRVFKLTSRFEKRQIKINYSS